MKIVNLIGASGSGKSTLAKRLESECNIVYSYTTREKREDGEYGHLFIEKGNRLIDCDGNLLVVFEDSTWHHVNDMVAREELYGNLYFAKEEQFVDNKINIYIVTPGGAEQVRDYYADSDVEIIDVFLNVSEEIRAKRIAKRLPDETVVGKGSDLLTVPEIWSRIKRDRDLFKVVKCDIVINGDANIDDVLNNLKEVLFND